MPCRPTGAAPWPRHGLISKWAGPMARLARWVVYFQPVGLVFRPIGLYFRYTYVKKFWKLYKRIKRVVPGPWRAVPACSLAGLFVPARLASYIHHHGIRLWPCLGWVEDDQYIWILPSFLVVIFIRFSSLFSFSSMHAWCICPSEDCVNASNRMCARILSWIFDPQ